MLIYKYNFFLFRSIHGIAAGYYPPCAKFTNEFSSKNMPDDQAGLLRQFRTERGYILIIYTICAYYFLCTWIGLKTGGKKI